MLKKYFNPKKNLKRLKSAFFYSIQGIFTAYFKEKAFKDLSIFFIFLALIILILPISVLDKFLIVGFWLLVMAAELINSALEILSNKITKEFDKEIKQIKDYGSAAVFILLVVWVLVCLVIADKYLILF